MFLIVAIDKEYVCRECLLDMLKWEDEDTMAIDDFVKAVACPLNPGLPDLDEFLEAYIYVDDIKEAIEEVKV